MVDVNKFFLQTLMLMTFALFDILIIFQLSGQTRDYDWVGEYANGLAPAHIEGSYGYIDGDGNIAIPFRFAAASIFREGLAMVKTGSVHEYSMVKIDTMGRIVWTFEHALKDNDNRDVLFGKEHSVIAASGLVIRDKPGADGRRLAAAPYKSKVTVIKWTDQPHKAEGINSRWAEVEYNGVRGFAFYGFLTKIDVEKFNSYFLYKWLDEFDDGQYEEMRKGYRESELFMEDSGVFLFYSFTHETCGRGQTMYVPQISMEEAFLLVKAACIDCYAVLESGNRGSWDRYVELKNYDYPGDMHLSKISFLLGDGLGFTTFSLEQDTHGYIRITR